MPLLQRKTVIDRPILVKGLLHPNVLRPTAEEWQCDALYEDTMAYWERVLSGDLDALIYAIMWTLGTINCYANVYFGVPPIFYGEKEKAGASKIRF